ncbi:MAG: orotate phosphoribosyltransferase [Gammaproteobacteria bacterium]|nr:MAG: orotate phosphoribosyltransferase [Gammaproteobacteria bacterium]
MKQFTKDFLDLSIELGILKFGEFKLKSERLSPYFFNAGLFNTGEALLKLGRYYAQALVDSEVEFDMLYGPAYKGITLAAATAILLANDHGVNVPYAYNRKEAKDHGEGGVIVGAPISGKVLIIDDVISAGTSVRESVEIIKQSGGEVAGVLIALDRQEKGKSDRSAVQEVERSLDTRVVSIAKLEQLVDYLGDADFGDDVIAAVKKYREQYAV